MIEDDSYNLPSFSEFGAVPFRAEPGSEAFTFYFESLSFQFFPGIRTSFIIAPPGMQAALAGAQLLTGRFHDESRQALLAEFLRSSQYESYLRRVARQYRVRMAFFEKEASRLLAGFGEVKKPCAGPFAVFRLCPAIPDQAVQSWLYARGVQSRALSASCREREGWNGLAFGVGGFTEEQIRRGIDAIGEACRCVSGAK